MVRLPDICLFLEPMYGIRLQYLYRYSVVF